VITCRADRLDVPAIIKIDIKPQRTNYVATYEVTNNTRSRSRLQASHLLRMHSITFPKSRLISGNGADHRDHKQRTALHQQRAAHRPPQPHLSDTLRVSPSNMLNLILSLLLTVLPSAATKLPT
jgi:hypothetical protein